MFDIFYQNPLWQTFWILAMLIAFSGLLQKDDKKTMKIIMFSMFFWMLHFYFMWVYAALVATFIWIIRILLSLKYKRNKRIFWAILAATIVWWLMTYENWYSILPIIWSSISAYWYFFFERIKLRFFMFVSSIFWFTFNISTWSIWWIINDFIIQIILIYVMYKMIIKEWKRVYVVEKVMSILQKSKPDFWRYIYIWDYIKITKISLIKKLIYFKKNILINVLNIIKTISEKIKFKKYKKNNT